MIQFLIENTTYRALTVIARGIPSDFLVDDEPSAASCRYGTGAAAIGVGAAVAAPRLMVGEVESS
jgi:hypothetical protein